MVTLMKMKKKIFIQNIKKNKPDIVFIAMGSPNQEIFMSKLYKEHKALYMGLGGSFDLFVGKVNKTPKIIQNLGFHWLYRALQEPKRFYKFIDLVKFVFYLFFTKKY